MKRGQDAIANVYADSDNAVQKSIVTHAAFSI